MNSVSQQKKSQARTQVGETHVQTESGTYLLVDSKPVRRASTTPPPLPLVYRSDNVEAPLYAVPVYVKERAHWGAFGFGAMLALLLGTVLFWPQIADFAASGRAKMVAFQDEQGDALNEQASAAIRSDSFQPSTERSNVPSELEPEGRTKADAPKTKADGKGNDGTSAAAASVKSRDAGEKVGVATSAAGPAGTRTGKSARATSETANASEDTQGQAEQKVPATPNADTRPGAVSAKQRSGRLALLEGRRLLKADRYEDAAPLFQKAYKNTGDASALYGLGYVEMNRENLDEAIAYFQRAYDQGYGHGLLGLGEAYRTKGARAEAIEVYERYLTKYPEGPGASLASHQLERLRK